MSAWIWCWIEKSQGSPCQIFGKSTLSGAPFKLRLWSQRLPYAKTDLQFGSQVSNSVWHAPRRQLCLRLVFRQLRRIHSTTSVTRWVAVKHTMLPASTGMWSLLHDSHSLEKQAGIVPQATCGRTVTPYLLALRKKCCSCRTKNAHAYVGLPIVQQTA